MSAVCETLVAASSLNVRLRSLTGVLGPTSCISIVVVPLGATSSTSRSRMWVCETSVSVTSTSVTTPLAPGHDDVRRVRVRGTERSGR